jgi:hypothetical protein
MQWPLVAPLLRFEYLAPAEQIVPVGLVQVPVPVFELAELASEPELAAVAAVPVSTPYLLPPIVDYTATIANPR